jgi:20S proteasome subunit alpha 3
MTLHAETKEPVAKIYRASELDELLRKLELGGTPDSEVSQGSGGGGAQEGSVSIST